jgi:long-chain-fatty-acid--CoA ligase ACSBG
MYSQFPQLGEDLRIVSYLPLSHIASQMIDIFFAISCGGTVWFAMPDAFKGSLIDTLRHAKPSFFIGVPQVWEKLADQIRLELGKSTGLIKKRFSEWAMVRV